MKIVRTTWMRTALSAVMAGALLAGCAQTPQTPAAAPTSAEAQRRAVFQLYVQQMLAGDEFYERTLNVSRHAPNFAALKRGLGGIYTDPVVMDWMLEQLQRGGSQEQFIGSVSHRMFSGLSRLDDDAALTLINVMGGMMSRMDTTQCEQFLRPGPDSRSRFTRMAAAMTADEVHGLFDTFRRAMRADISERPLRPVPTGANMAKVTAGLARLQAGDAARADGNSCHASASLMQAVSAMSGEERSGAITFVLAMMGMGAKQAQQRTVVAR